MWGEPVDRFLGYWRSEPVVGVVVPQAAYRPRDIAKHGETTRTGDQPELQVRDGFGVFAQVGIPCQGEGRGFESRRPLHVNPLPSMGFCALFPSNGMAIPCTGQTCGPAPRRKSLGERTTALSLVRIPDSVGPCHLGVWRRWPHGGYHDHQRAVHDHADCSGSCDNDPRTDHDDHPGSCDNDRGLTAYATGPRRRRATPRRCDRGFGYRTGSPPSRNGVRFLSGYRTQGPWRYRAL